MVILGGAGTLSGPIVGAAIIVLVTQLVSAYVEHWNRCCSARIFVARHHVHARGAGARRRARLASAAARGRAARPRRRGTAARMSEPLLRAARGLQVVRRRAGRARRRSHGRAGRAPPDHRTERRRQDDALQPDHRRRGLRPRLDRARSTPSITHLPSRAARARSGIARTYQIISCSRTTAAAQRRARPARAVARCAGTRSTSWRRGRTSATRRDRDPGDGAASTASRTGAVAQMHLRRAAARRDRAGARAAAAAAAARRAARRPVAGGARRRAAAARAIPPTVTVLMIEHDMDMALDARRAHHGAAFRRGHRRGHRAPRWSRDPRTREVYLGD